MNAVIARYIGKNILSLKNLGIILNIRSRKLVGIFEAEGAVKSSRLSSEYILCVGYSLYYVKKGLYN